MADQKDEQINDLKNQIEQRDKQIIQDKATIAERDEQINNFKAQITQKDQQINDLTNGNKTKDNQIKELNSKLTEKDNSINSLNKQLTEKANEIGKQTNNINQKNQEINKIKEDFNKIKIDNENKIKQQEEEISKKNLKIKELEDKVKNNEEMKKLKEDNKLILLENEKLKKIIIPEESLLNEKINYDINLNFNLIKNIKEGWELNFSEIGLKYFNTPIKCQKIGILGNKRVGKSFILSRLFGLNNPQNPIYSSEKISIKIKQRNNRVQFMVFDSKGFNDPILGEKEENNFNNIDKDNKDQEKNEINIVNKEEKEIINNNEIKEKNKEKNIINCSDNINNITNSFFYFNNEDIEEIKNNQNINELLTNKCLIEEFITSFMVEYSDILIVVVGLLNHSDQILLNKVMEECLKKNKNNLYVIHNLQSFITKEQVSYYIKNVLMNSATFNLEEKKDIILDDLFESEEDVNKDNMEELENDNPYYYISFYKSLIVNHLIFINDNCDEKSYNTFTMKKMATFINNSRRTEFNILEKIKDKIFELLNVYSENVIEKENIILDENKKESNKRKIIYKGNSNLKLRRYLKNEESNTRSEFRPRYSYYISTKEGKEKLIILIETPGEITDENIIPGKTKNNKEYLIQYKGKKCLIEEENNQKDDIKIVGREFGEFILDITIPLKGYEILNLKEPKCHNEKGIEFIEYELKNISNINIELKNGVGENKEKKF